MKVLLLGSGGREHALVWKMRQSPLVSRLYCAPGNAGIAKECNIAPLDPSDHAALITFCIKEAIGLVVVGPEAYLVEGVVDALENAGIPAFGPTQLAARLEGSKGFTKDLCGEFGIPTAMYARFSAAEPAKAYVKDHGAPIVVKADGLAAGKGVVVAMTLEEALAAVDMMFDGGMGAAGTEVVIEEFMTGEEVSFFALCDGEKAVMLGSAQDHKRVGDGDVGPNTGGMGAYSPAPMMDEALAEQVMQRIIHPTVEAMKRRGAPFKGVLFAGLMLTPDGPKLIEYNCRFGDPECQVLMMRLDEDIVPWLMAVAKGALPAHAPRLKPEAALTVVMAAKGYPASPQKGGLIGNLDEAERLGAKVFHAGTSWSDDALVAAGGRVLNVTATANTIRQAREKAYDAVRLIDFPAGFCRSDIGWRAIQREV